MPVTSLEELKSKLVQVIVVALIVSLFKKMLNLPVAQAIDLAYIAFAILLISVSSYLLQLQYQAHHPPAPILPAAPPPAAQLPATTSDQFPD
ncbi:MAG: hypothetical protein ACO331_13370 [Prochlorothrix sp.]